MKRLFLLLGVLLCVLGLLPFAGCTPKKEEIPEALKHPDNTVKKGPKGMPMPGP